MSSTVFKNVILLVWLLGKYSSGSFFLGSTGTGGLGSYSCIEGLSWGYSELLPTDTPYSTPLHAGSNMYMGPRRITIPKPSTSFALTRKTLCFRMKGQEVIRSPSRPSIIIQNYRHSSSPPVARVIQFQDSTIRLSPTQLRNAVFSPHRCLCFVSLCFAAACLCDLYIP